MTDLDRLAWIGTFQELAHLAAALSDQRDDDVSKPSHFASIVRRVDFPTPEPAKIPMRCPSQMGVNRSMALTPVRNGVLTLARVIARGGSASFDTE